MSTSFKGSHDTEPVPLPAPQTTELGDTAAGFVAVGFRKRPTGGKHQWATTKV